LEDWAEIRRLHRAEGMPIKAIVRKLGIARNTVRKALAADEPPVYRRADAGSAVDAVEPQIRVLLKEWPTMPATVIAERIGWDRSMTSLKDRVRVLRPLFLPADPSSRTTYLPGELIQCDLWFPAVDIPLGFGQVARPPVLVMVSGYSRWMQALMLPSRKSGDLLAGHWVLLQRLGAVARSLVWDNESAVGSWRSGRPQLTAAFAGFAGTLGVGVIQCKPRDPEAKGLVERANEYLETSYLPGRSFTGAQDFNTQLSTWLERANTRQHRTIGCRPADRWPGDRDTMLALPPLAPLVGWQHSTRLPRDHYVRLASNDYSVHPSVIGRRVEVRADLDTVTVTCAGQVVAEHERCWARHQSLTDPAHYAAAVAMRTAKSTPNPALATIPDQPGTDRRSRQVQVQVRPLADYDALFAVPARQVRR
jgi:transposase